MALRTVFMLIEERLGTGWHEGSLSLIKKH